MARIVVTKDGADASPILPDENAAAAWLLDHQGQSVHYATTYGGYAFRKTTERWNGELEGYGSCGVLGCKECE